MKTTLHLWDAFGKNNHNTILIYSYLIHASFVSFFFSSPFNCICGFWRIVWRQEKAKKLRKIARLAAQGITKGGGRKHKKRPAADGGDPDAANDDEWSPRCATSRRARN